MRKFVLLSIIIFSLIGHAFAGATSKVIGATTVDAMFAKRLLDMQYTFVDVRPADDFQKGHIPGAKSLAFANFNRENLEAIVKKGDEVIIYGEGSLSSISANATKSALEWGWSKVFYFRYGYGQWSTVGLAVEK